MKTIRKKDIMRAKKTKTALLKELSENLDVNITSICQKIGIHRSTYYQWLKDDEKFREIVIETKEFKIDLAEKALLEAIARKDTKATIFYLKTRGRSRGYF